MNLIKLPEVAKRMARSKTALYADIKEHLLTPGVPIGKTAVAWPEHEIATLNEAKVAGLQRDSIKKLVDKMIADRARSRASLEATAAQNQDNQPTTASC